MPDNRLFWVKSGPLWILAGIFSLLSGLFLGDVRLYFPAIVFITLGVIPHSHAHIPKQTNIPMMALLVVCFFINPDLSDDFHRYLWEGHVQNNGYSPYQHSPQDLYDHFDHPSEGLINHDHLPAIYPPLAQYLFQLSDFFSPYIWSWKAVLLLWCLLWLPALPKSSFKLLYLVPAVLFEGWWNGHLDLAGIFPTLLLVQAIDKKNGLLGGFALGTVIALKTMPLIWFPFLFFYFKGKQKLLFSSVTFLIVFICYVPFLSQGEDLFFSFVTFSKSWFFNNLLFVGLSSLVSDNLARLTLTCLFALAYVLIFFSKRGVTQKCLAAWVFLIICSPTFFPWYLLWLVPFLNQQSLKVFNLAYVTAFISYWVLVGFRQHGLWQEQLFWLIPEWLLLSMCFFAMLKPQSVSKFFPIEKNDTSGDAP